MNAAAGRWRAEEQRAFADEMTLLNLKRCRFAAIAGLMAIFWTTVLNFMVPGFVFAEYRTWMLVCAGAYGGLLLAWWRLTRPGASMAARRRFVVLFVIALLFICDGFGFVLSTRLPSVSSIARGVLLVALIFVIPPSRFLALAAANELVLTTWAMWRGADTTTLTVFVDGTISMVVGVVASWLLYEAKRGDFQQRRALERHAAEMDEVMAITAHDLRSPLLGVKNLLTLASSRAGLERERLVAVVGDATRAVDRMLSLVSRLVEAHAAEHGGEHRAVPGDLREALVGAIERMRPAAEAKQIVLELTLPEGEALAHFDEAAFGQLLDNLLANALKFSPPQSRVAASLREAGNTWRIEVADAGPGVPEAERPRLFQKYARGTARPTGGEAGSGLGLFIVKTLADRMRAQVGYAPGAPHGAVFHVEVKSVRS